MNLCVLCCGIYVYVSIHTHTHKHARTRTHTHIHARAHTRHTPAVDLLSGGTPPEIILCTAGNAGPSPSPIMIRIVIRGNKPAPAAMGVKIVHRLHSATPAPRTREPPNLSAIQPPMTCVYVYMHVCCYMCVYMYTL